jgi:release factor glutamine methyltransferase
MIAAGLRPHMTLGEARRALAGMLHAGGVDNPQLDARVILCHVLGLDHAGLVTRDSALLGRAESERLAELARRRVGGEPVARLVGRKEFWGLEFQLGPDTLVPRPETELLVETALAAARAMAPEDGLRIADLGVGSGAILLALLSELPAASGIGTDRSFGALVTARANAQRLALASRASFAVSHFGEALAGGFDLVVSNPPYVASGDIASLAPDVRDHDPRAALDGGPDGLDAFRAIAADASRLIRPRGRLGVELGAGQAAAAGAIFAAAGLRPIGPLRHDLAGIPRVLLLAAAAG